MNFQSTVIVVSIINDSLLIPVPSINLSATSLISEISFDNYSDIVDRLLEILESKRGASFILFDSCLSRSVASIDDLRLQLAECRREGNFSNSRWIATFDETFPPKMHTPF